MDFEELKDRGCVVLNPNRVRGLKSKKYLLGYAAGVDAGSTGLVNKRYYDSGKKLKDKVSSSKEKVNQ